MPPARVVSILLFLLFLLAPHVSAADPFIAPLFTYYNENNYGSLFMDDPPGGILTGFNYHSPERRAELRGAAGTFKIVDGYLEVTSGPFIRENPGSGDNHDATYDVFGAGGSVHATWVIALPDGSTREIDFSADLGVWGGDSREPTSLDFFHGRFDEDDAAVLGVPPRWLKGRWDLYLDNNGDRGETYREYKLYGRMDAYSVPEPSIAVLLLAGLALRKWRAA